MNPVKLLLIGGGAYLLYQAYLKSQSASAPIQSVPAFPATPAPPPVAGSVATPGDRGPLLQTGAGYNSVWSGSGDSLMLSPDEWAYWFVRLPGKSQVNAPGPVMESILTKLGLSDTTRSTLVSVDQFLGAAQSAGLSGLAGPALPEHMARPALLALANSRFRPRGWGRPVTLGDLRAAVQRPTWGTR